MNQDAQIHSLKEEKNNIKKTFSNKLINDLEIILEKCFLNHKHKKEQLVTKEQLTIELLKLLMNQKRFKNSESYYNNLVCYSAFSTSINQILKISNIDIKNRKLTYTTYFKPNEVITSCFGDEDIMLFDFYTPLLEHYLRLQNQFNGNVCFKDMYAFLAHQDNLVKNVIKRVERIVPLEHSSHISVHDKDFLRAKNSAELVTCSNDMPSKSRIVKNAEKDCPVVKHSNLITQNFSKFSVHDTNTNISRTMFIFDEKRYTVLKQDDRTRIFHGMCIDFNKLENLFAEF